MGGAACHPWMKEFHTLKFPQVHFTQYFSEVMAKLLLAVVTTMDNAPFQRWMKVCHTARYLQENGTRCFSEVMAKQ